MDTGHLFNLIHAAVTTFREHQWLTFDHKIETLTRKLFTVSTGSATIAHELVKLVPYSLVERGPLGLIKSLSKFEENIGTCVSWHQAAICLPKSLGTIRVVQDITNL